MSMMASHIVDEFGSVVDLADFLPRQPAQPAPPSKARRRLVPIYRSEANAAGTASDLVNAKIVAGTAQALAGPDGSDAEAVADAVAMLREIAPRDGREAMIAAQLIATHTATMDSLALARSAGPGLLRDVHLGHAARLAHAHAALSEALDRIRRRDRQTVVFEYRHSH